ncbi:hypothetical protein [Oceanithermus desulfurans]
MNAKQRATVALFGAAGGTVGTFFALRGGEDPLTAPALLLGFLVGFAVSYALLALIYRSRGG